MSEPSSRLSSGRRSGVPVADCAALAQSVAAHSMRAKQQTFDDTDLVARGAYQCMSEPFGRLSSGRRSGVPVADCAALTQSVAAQSVRAKQPAFDNTDLVAVAPTNA